MVLGGPLTGAAVPAAVPVAVPVAVLVDVPAQPAGVSTAQVRATPSPAPTRPTGPEPTDEVDEDAPDVDVAVTEVSPQVLRPADELVVRATVRNTGDLELAEPRVRLRISRFLQSTRGSLEQWSEQALDDTAGTPVGVPLALDEPLAAGASVDVELRVPAADLRLSTADTAWGPRGISVEVTDAGRRQGIERTFVLWRPTEQVLTPTRLSVLVPLTGGPVDPTASGTSGPVTPEPDASGPGTAAPPDGTRATPVPGALTEAVVDRLDDVLEVTAGIPAVSWALDPALLGAARAPGAGSGASGWVSDLTAAATGREVFPLPSRDPDLAALAHGAGGELAALATATSAAVTDPVLGSPVRPGLAWPAVDVPDLATVALASSTGAASVVVGGDGLAPDGLTYTPTGRATVTTPDGPVAALVADDVLSDQLDSPRDTTPAAAAQRVLAETAVVTMERPTEQRHLLVTADRGWAPDPAVAAAQLTALEAAPWVDLAPLSALLGAPDPEVDRDVLPERRVDEGEIAASALQELLRARAQLAVFSSVVADPSGLVDGTDDAVLAATSVAWRSDPEQRRTVVRAVVDDLTARRSGVSIVLGSSLNLISQSGRFPVGLRNDLTQDATIQVAVAPTRSRLVVEGTETVTVPAGSETQARIPFRAVGSGDVVVEVTLLTPEGVPLAAPQRFTVRVHADWENVGTAVVAGLLGVAFVVGIVRTIRRGQTSTRGAGSTPVAEIAALPGDDA
ncbi:DUF6049 family protein [Cellulomonas aerilata]|uniref:DUF6049 family protein n=1 Tax=Cellulomonas aerilata TaxID=515326 RepID=UPI0011BE7DE4|nr:DUF6049 family protein [Cellulomonas aerilata]